MTEKLSGRKYFSSVLVWFHVAQTVSLCDCVSQIPMRRDLRHFSADDRLKRIERRSSGGQTEPRDSRSVNKATTRDFLSQVILY